MTYATIDDYNARRETPIEESAAVARIETKLEDASALVAAECAAAGVRLRGSRLTCARAIVCAMVDRATQEGLPHGMTFMQQTAGPYMFSGNVAGPSGDLYLTSQERRMLGIGRAKLGFMAPRRTT